MAAEEPVELALAAGSSVSLSRGGGYTLTLPVAPAPEAFGSKAHELKIWLERALNLEVAVSSGTIKVMGVAAGAEADVVASVKAELREMHAAAVREHEQWKAQEPDRLAGKQAADDEYERVRQATERAIRGDTDQ